MQTKIISEVALELAPANVPHIFGRRTGVAEIIISHLIKTTPSGVYVESACLNLWHSTLHFGNVAHLQSIFFPIVAC